MGKTTDNAEQTASTTEMALLEAQEKMAQMEAELKAANEAKVKAEKQAEIANAETVALKAEMEAAKSRAINAKVTMPVEEERVKIKLFKDNKDYKDDLTVVVNGKAYQIQRGVEVEIPKSVAEVIEHSAAQDQKTAELIDSLVAETQQKEREM